MRSSLLLPILVGTGFLTCASAYATNVVEAADKIDRILTADWAAHNLTGNPQADDTTFLRRIYLDIIGRIPTTREAEIFLTSEHPNKRAQLIDQLLASDGYAQHAFNYWADVLRLQTKSGQSGVITGAAYANYLKNALQTNRPYDEIVQDLVAAQGKAWDNGAIGYYMRDRGMPLDNMAATVRVFLGTRIECAQCHNHPFDKWTQMDFFKMAAFTYNVNAQDYSDGTIGEAKDRLREQEVAVRAAFKEPTRIKKQKGLSDQEYQALQAKYEAERQEMRAKQEKARTELKTEQRNYQEAFNDLRDTMRYTSVTTSNRTLTLPHDYQYDDAKPKSPVAPGTMMGHACEPLPGETPLQAYARWMTAKENPRFTSVIVNRLWKRAFGLALIEPLDELMDATTPMIPSLQSHLETLMRDLNYDMKAFQRIVFNTAAYQRQVTRDEYSPGTIYHFTGPLLRRMSAEQMWDSFVTLINPSPDMPNLTQRADAARVVLNAKKNADAIDSLSPEELLDGIKVSAKVYDANRAKTEALQKLYLEARTEGKILQEKVDLATGDEQETLTPLLGDAKKRIDSLRSEINILQNQGRRTTAAEVLLPGKLKLYEKVTGKPYGSPIATTTSQSDPTDEDPAMMASMMMSSGGKTSDIAIPGYDASALTDEERKAAQEAETNAFIEEAKFFKLPDTKWKEYGKARKQQMKDFLRAAELDSPAPRGHYLREFGQSDREVIENANAEASVPQALAMMNGRLMPQILSQYSQLMLTVQRAEYPDDQLEAIYMAVLSRPPTANEKDTWATAQNQKGSSLEDLVFALLNTQQFIFVQ